MTDQITDFRNKVKNIIFNEIETSSNKDVIVLALDGIHFDLANLIFSGARISSLRTVFPSTSSTAWLSALSGTSPEEHGIPGVVFRYPNERGELINIYDYCGPLKRGGRHGNIFSDAISLGYDALSIPGDLLDSKCSWMDLLLTSSTIVSDVKFYTSTGFKNKVVTAKKICGDLFKCLDLALSRETTKNGKLIWAFLEIDKHIHINGYDDHVNETLSLINRYAIEQSKRGNIVIAHSDHGLTPTINSPNLSMLMSKLAQQYSFEMGGAGRVRWLYLNSEIDKFRLRGLLENVLPDDIEICFREKYFDIKSLAYSRIGEIILISKKESFITSPNFKFDHGSETYSEMMTPYAIWDT